MYAFTINLREFLNPNQHIDWSGKKKTGFGDYRVSSIKINYPMVSINVITY